MTRVTLAHAFLNRWRWYLCGAGAACTLLWSLYFLSSFQHRPRVVPRPHSFPGNTTLATPPENVPSEPVPFGPDAAGNSTLGFQAILALSPFPSWRTTGLQAAAHYTGLEIQIPPQPPIHPEIIDAFAALGPEEARHPNHGSALAWVAHLDLIKHVVQSGFDTALILEDDVDWDVSIRDEMVAIAEAVRQLTNTGKGEAAPYGRDWDVLWVGLCAETWDKEFKTVYVDDPTVCPLSKYVGLAKGPMERMPKGQRAVFHSGAPICTFAYALTREGAKNVLLDVGAGKDEAFDIALMNGCRERNLTCISVLPELFRHYKPSPNLTGSLVNSGENREIVEAETEMGFTENILMSARCHALWGKPCLEPPKPDEPPSEDEPSKEQHVSVEE
ncbi:hypothetical protein BJY01DRAFT_88723 [Aspergillus pseudoustus]|uniref:Glycosyltransferase family 25 protein n=1 Tax=Aspergillus pseudoustus TaxID=1810923 RepID=A0ABR4J250_9EURO